MHTQSILGTQNETKGKTKVKTQSIELILQKIKKNSLNQIFCYYGISYRMEQF